MVNVVKLVWITYGKLNIMELFNDTLFFEFVDNTVHIKSNGIGSVVHIWTFPELTTMARIDDTLKVLIQQSCLHDSRPTIGFA